MSKFIKYILGAVGIIGLAGAVSASAGSKTVIQNGTGFGTLGGYYFGEEKATGPSGNEWQCPDSISYNKELPRATFYYFGDAESARKVLPENSEYWMSLDGVWKFNWVKEPS
ncbi:MAG: hypothetical protein K2J63_05430, partial [Muribaculaceae bacterium]|nr:hypothetical protein [Muribaculaceae bacterium]